MAHAGQAIANPVTGERVVFRATAADSGGRLLSMEYHAPAQHLIAPIHTHPRQEEPSAVVAGRLRGRVGGQRRTVGSGEVAVVAPGVRHTWRSDGNEELEAVIEFRPALDTETVLEIMFALARAGKTDRRGMPAPLQMAVLMNDHIDEMAAPLLPLAVERAIVRGLAAVGRRRGYRSEPAALLRVSSG